MPMGSILLLFYMYFIRCFAFGWRNQVANSSIPIYIIGIIMNNQKLIREFALNDAVVQTYYDDGTGGARSNVSCKC